MTPHLVIAAGGALGRRHDRPRARPGRTAACVSGDNRQRARPRPPSSRRAGRGGDAARRPGAAVDAAAASRSTRASSRRRTCIVRGKALYEANCASCHAVDLRGGDERVRTCCARARRSTTSTASSSAAAVEQARAAHHARHGRRRRDRGVHPQRPRDDGRSGQPAGTQSDGRRAERARRRREGRRERSSAPLCSKCHSVTAISKGIGAKYPTRERCRTRGSAGSAGRLRRRWTRRRWRRRQSGDGDDGRRVEGRGHARSRKTTGSSSCCWPTARASRSRAIRHRAPESRRQGSAGSAQEDGARARRSGRTRRCTTSPRTCGRSSRREHCMKRTCCLSPPSLVADPRCSSRRRSQFPSRARARSDPAIPTGKARRFKSAQPAGCRTSAVSNPADIWKPLADEWRSYSGDLSGKRFSALKLVNTTTVKNLSLKWITTLQHGLRPDRHARRLRRAARRGWRSAVADVAAAAVAAAPRRSTSAASATATRTTAATARPAAASCSSTASSTRRRRTTSTRSTRATARCSGTTTGRRAAARACRPAASACGATTSTSSMHDDWVVCLDAQDGQGSLAARESRRSTSSTSRRTRRWSSAITSSSAPATTSTRRRS